MSKEQLPKLCPHVCSKEQCIKNREAWLKADSIELVDRWSKIEKWQSYKNLVDWLIREMLEES